MASTSASATFELPQLRPHDRLETPGTDAVAELAVRMPRDVRLHRQPVVLIVANLLAVRADRKDLPQRPHLRERLFERADERRALFLGLLALGDVARHGVDHAVAGVRRGVPQEPAVAAVLGEIPILEAARLAAAAHVGVLVERAIAIVGMHELDEPARHQLFAREAERALPGGIEPAKVAVEVEHAEHVERDFKESFKRASGIALVES